ncbi:MAG: undecaprenyl-phosphate glucose phosphotransferase [Planctomycetota bacterium]
MSDKVRQSIRRHDSWPRLAQKLSDSLAALIGLFTLVYVVPDLNSKSTIVVGIIAIGVYSMIAEFVGLYRDWRGIPFAREATCTAISWVLTLVCLAALGRFSIYSSEISGRGLLLWFAVSPALSLTARFCFRAAFRWTTARGINTRSYAVVGANELGLELIRNINETPDLGLNLLGFFDDRPEDRHVELPPEAKSKLGRFDDLVQAARSGDVEVIFITLPMRAEKRIRSVIADLADSTASVYIVPDLFVFQMLNSRWTDIQGLPVVSVSENPFNGVDGAVKRTLDVAFSAFGIVLAAIPMALIALAVKLTSRGPVLFVQKRYGLDGKVISVWKFRSMTVTENGDKVVQATKNDSRVTTVGAFLRKSSLDELPQLFNVFTGRMSLVGPRPHANAHNEYYRKQIEGYMLRHKVKPGITGLAQVSGCRGETETIQKMQDRITFDHKYIREWSIWLDLKILIRTLFVVFKRENAY